MAQARIVPIVAAGAALEDVRALFREYSGSLPFSLCFQGFDAELHELPGAYGPPRGVLLLAQVDGAPAGCVALRPESGDAAELKRLYVRDAFRGQGLGRALTEAAIDAARELGYARLRLDTTPSMRAAIAMYQSMGFRDIAPYGKSPIEGARFLELQLAVPGRGGA
jgi:GNAT superfamily N-acetyltransferase